MHHFVPCFNFLMISTEKFSCNINLYVTQHSPVEHSITMQIKIYCHIMDKSFLFQSNIYCLKCCYLQTKGKQLLSSQNFEKIRSWSWQIMIEKNVHGLLKLPYKTNKHNKSRSASWAQIAIGLNQGLKTWEYVEVFSQWSLPSSQLHGATKPQRF